MEHAHSPQEPMPQPQQSELVPYSVNAHLPILTPLPVQHVLTDASGLAQPPEQLQRPVAHQSHVLKLHPEHADQFHHSMLTLTPFVVQCPQLTPLVLLKTDPLFQFRFASQDP
jgi:hypothetical protein